ncbi:MAG: GNAT family N-acetyltransferase [Comamonadaceae bacterium]|nr:MAG: GNAT family N-acetyltransferase [Comamonadaceae bacterium]
MADSVIYRRACQPDLTSLRLLATQVYLDTYATQGISPTLAREVIGLFSEPAMALRLNSADVEITVAEVDGHLVGFLDLTSGGDCPAASVQGAEVRRLYVQRTFHRAGIGRQLLRLAEERAAQRGSQWLWLTAWSGNGQALAFYARVGYQDMGSAQHWIEGVAYENRVLARQLNDPITRETP